MNQIINMIIRQVMNQLLRRGMNAGFDRLGSMGKKNQNNYNQPPDAIDDYGNPVNQPSGLNQQQAKQSMTAMRRLNKF